MRCKALKLNETITYEIPAIVNKKIGKFNVELEEFMRYTNDEMPFLDRDGDFYGISKLVIIDKYMCYDIITSHRTTKEKVPMFYEDEYDNTIEFQPMYFNDQMKELKADMKRGLKYYKTFNAGTDEDADGNINNKFIEE